MKFNFNESFIPDYETDQPDGVYAQFSSQKHGLPVTYSPEP